MSQAPLKAKNIKFAIHLLLAIWIALIPSFIFLMPSQPIVMVELITESLFLGVCLVIYYYFSQFNVLTIQLGWALFCAGLALDIGDEIADTSGVIHKNAEDLIAMLGVMLVALGFNRASSELLRAMDIIREQTEHYKGLAHTDKLTGLANREKLISALNGAISNSKINDSHVSVIFLDLNKFKPANDKYGHDIGDLLLQAVASRLLRVTREDDIVCRWGGDEFLILQSGFTHEEAAANLCKRVYESFYRPFKVHQFEIDLGASIGYSIFPKDADSADQLIKRADMAMYEAKSTHGKPQRFNLELSDKTEQTEKLTASEDTI